VRVRGRDPATITLVSGDKTFPASDVRLLAGLGVRDIGENRDVEGAARRPRPATSASLAFIGRLQTNKARSVAAGPTSCTPSTGRAWSRP
jgi:uncharacterized pyridoxal phosphate-containing UPF0001 family protein